ncbi:MAG: bifunctional phosphoribosylaminoimidazolecarboxamide formyltransferase/IMP cyclohydrolase [bacterium]
MDINRVLISVSDKKNLVEFAHELVQMGADIVSTGGTTKTLIQAEVHATEISQLTQFPEILDGRVKTLHPKIFGALLAKRNNITHEHQLRQLDIQNIDMVVVNLYPFTNAVQESGITEDELIEYIDIGGVALLRAAAKNYNYITVVSDPDDYKMVINQLKEHGTISLDIRKRLAAKAFTHTSYYDAVIARYFSEKLGKTVDFQKEMTIGLKKAATLRYGENPHQRATLYKITGGRNWGIVNAKQLHGKELSFNNYLDLDAAWETVSEFTEPACVIVKHNNPCGVAIAAKQLQAYKKALECDSISAFGGIVALNREVDSETAEELTKLFLECIIAPGFMPEALSILKKKQNLRLLAPESLLASPNEIEIRQISGGLLVQEKDNQIMDSKLKVVTNRKPSSEEMTTLEFAWKVCKHIKSNAILLARNKQSVGVGAGQMSRIDSLRIAVQKMKAAYPIVQAKTSTSERNMLVLASDAFLPFRDVVDEAAKEGVTAIIQPGGSIRDQDSIDACNEHNISMVFTGMRHFRH